MPVGPHGSSQFYGLIGEQDPQIPQVISRRPGFDRISKRFKQRIGVEFIECSMYIQVSRAGTLDGAAIHDCARSRAVSIDSIGSGAKDRNILASDRLSTGQRELLI